MEILTTYYNDAFNNPVVWLYGALVVSDIFLGNIMAWTTKIYTSKKGIIGAIKHLGVFFVVMLLLPMVSAVSESSAISISIVAYLCYLYAVSVIENLAKLGFPIPEQITDRLTQVVESRLQIKIDDDEEHQITATMTQNLDAEGRPKGEKNETE